MVIFGKAGRRGRGETSKNPSRPTMTAWDGEENEKREGIAFLSVLQETICGNALRAIRPRMRYALRARYVQGRDMSKDAICCAGRNAICRKRREGNEIPSRGRSKSSR